MKIAILGAECTGKTRLAQALASSLQREHPGTVWVAEYLREWCDAHGRTPRADEQAAIARMQMERTLAQVAAPIVLSDTAPLMTAIYSDLLFGDTSLYALAVAQQRSFDLTLVAGLDLPWVADGVQRDGVSMRAQVDQRLREVLQQHQISFSAVYGAGEARTRSALQAIGFALGKPGPDRPGSHWKWSCEKCSDPDCEHRLFSALLQTSKGDLAAGPQQG
jgi:nicotinamide riboside kinase